MAHAVHVASRRTGAFIFVSCPELHTRSRRTPDDAATGARSEGSFLSRLELAAGGTLFLDNVHELPSEFQHALIELLEQRPSRHPGTEPKTDTRVIASTPHDLIRSVR